MKTYLILAISVVCLILSLSPDSVQAQPGQQQIYFTGCQFDEAEHLAVPSVVTMLTRSYRSVPKAHSLKSYAPYAGYQGKNHSCSGWATSYGARTILWAIQNKQTDRMAITENAFSAYYPYNQVKIHDVGCLGGASIPKCLDIITKQGVPNVNEYPNECDYPITDDNRRKAEANKIYTYNRLEPSETIGKEDLIKKSISANKPVVISMQVYSSFYKAKDVWVGKQEQDQFKGLHAMAIVGYDDEKSGGAFEVMNSWSEQWGNSGFMWVKYDDLVGETRSLYELSDKIPIIKPKKNSPSSDKKGDTITKTTTKSTTTTTTTRRKKVKKPNVFKPKKQTPKKEPNKKIKVVKEEEVVTRKLKGKITLVNDEGVEMPAKLVSYATQKTRGFDVVKAAQSNYMLRMAYSSGTKFRIEVENNEPAYVYILGSDLTAKTDLLFPHNNISSFIDYKDAAFALPDEAHYIQMDEEKGTDYLCVLYARQPLKIEAIRAAIQSEKGHFVEKVNRVLAKHLIAADDVIFEKNNIAFEAQSINKSTVAVVIEVDHK